MLTSDVSDVPPLTPGVAPPRRRPPLESSVRVSAPARDDTAETGAEPVAPATVRPRLAVLAEVARDGSEAFEGRIEEIMGFLVKQVLVTPSSLDPVCLRPYSCARRRSVPCGMMC